MASYETAENREKKNAAPIRDHLARSLGVRQERKQEIYLDLSRSASLKDVAYWLQILFAAGIATLGLVLNSPAVIIGAMLISPLMGPILAGGLALASGDLVLGLRAIANLALSCFVAVMFAVLLVSLLPFREMTTEIASRTRPNTLDLVVALFSGAIGSIAICKEVKGVVTSIPGVAIAVALMPPLCVMGYGVGIALSVSGAEGMRTARGGGLLFLTNLVAITFMAMVVFLALHIDTADVKARAKEWSRQDPESAWVRALFARFPISMRMRKIGGLPGRIISVVILIIILLIPLGESFNQLKREIGQQQQENRIRQTAVDLWQQGFAKLPDGKPRSYIDQLSPSEQDGKVNLYLRVFTIKPLALDERAEYTKMLAARLDEPPDSIALNLVEVPTATSELLAKASEPRPVQPAPPTIAQLQANFLQRIGSELGGMRLPPPAQLVDYEIVTGESEPLRITLAYLSERDIEADAQALIVEDVRARLAYPTAVVDLKRIPAAPSEIPFRRNSASLSASDMELLDQAGQILASRPGLHLELVEYADKSEREGIAQERASVMKEYLISKWQVASDRITSSPGEESKRGVELAFKIRQEKK